MKTLPTNALARFAAPRTSAYRTLAYLFLFPGLFLILALWYIQWVIGIQLTLMLFGVLSV